MATGLILSLSRTFLWSGGDFDEHRLDVDTASVYSVANLLSQISRYCDNKHEHYAQLSTIEVQENKTCHG